MSECFLRHGGGVAHDHQVRVPNCKYIQLNIDEMGSAAIKTLKGKKPSL